MGFYICYLKSWEVTEYHSHVCSQSPGQFVHNVNSYNNLQNYILGKAIQQSVCPFYLSIYLPTHPPIYLFLQVTAELSRIVIVKCVSQLPF